MRLLWALIAVVFARSATQAVGQNAAIETPRATRVAVLHLGFDDEGKQETPVGWGILGLSAPLDAFERAADELKASRADIVVIRINSEGGVGRHTEFLDLLDKRYRPQFRLVAWVKRAYGESALMAYSIPELCMTSDAQMNGAVWQLPGMGPSGTAVVAAWCAAGDRAAAAGGRPLQIMQSMQQGAPLSMKVQNGARVFTSDLSDEGVINFQGRLLTLSAEAGLRTGVSLGTVETREQLAKTLHLGAVEWVGEDVDRRVQERCAEARRVTVRVEQLVGDIEEGRKRVCIAAARPAERAEAERLRVAAWDELVRLRTASKVDVERWFKVNLREIEETERAAKWQPDEKTRVAVLNIGRDQAAGPDPKTLEIHSWTFPVSALVKAADDLKAAGADVVVLKFNEGDACGTDAFIGAVERSFLPRFRTMGWIASAIDEGGVAALAMPGVCMTPDGHWGKSICHIWNFTTCDALAEHAAKVGKKPLALARAFVYVGPLSISVVDGKRVYTSGEGGDVVLASTSGIGLNAHQAEAIGVSVGTAGTREELRGVLGLGEVEWVCDEADARLQMKCDEAVRDFKRVEELSMQAYMANGALSRSLSDERHKREQVIRAAAWGEINRIRAAWPELANLWPPILMQVLAGGVHLDANWEAIAREIGVQKNKAEKK